MNSDLDKKVTHYFEMTQEELTVLLKMLDEWVRATNPLPDGPDAEQKQIYFALAEARDEGRR